MGSPAAPALVRGNRAPNKFFEYLSRTRKLESELTAIRQSTPIPRVGKGIPLPPTFLPTLACGARISRKRAGAESLAAQYPAELKSVITASSVFRSLACFDPADTTIAQDRRRPAAGQPTDTEIMARIGDIYADREQVRASRALLGAHSAGCSRPSGGYLEAATIYWDYFDFDNAMRLLGKGASASPSQACTPTGWSHL